MMETALIIWFETLTMESLGDLERYYTEDAVFRDPFQKVCGQAAIKRIFQHMFRQLQNPHFVVTSWLRRDQELCLFWEFHAASGNKAFMVEGCSRMLLNAEDRITEHVDFWDPSVIWRSWPLLGSWVRLLHRACRA